jgi:molecular chaperone DnaJ
MKNYYKILEVEENASEEEIKKSYRNLSKKFHPDVNPNGAEQFKEINEAYETLGDKGKKQTYDMKRKNPYQGSQFESFFDNIFNRNQQQGPRRKSAPDKIIKVQISPIES